MVFVTLETPHTTSKKEPIPLGYKHDDPKNTRFFLETLDILGVIGWRQNNVRNESAGNGGARLFNYRVGLVHGTQYSNPALGR